MYYLLHGFVSFVLTIDASAMVNLLKNNARCCPTARNSAIMLVSTVQIRRGLLGQRENNKELVERNTSATTPPSAKFSIDPGNAYNIKHRFSIARSFIANLKSYNPLRVAIR